MGDRRDGVESDVRGIESIRTSEVISLLDAVLLSLATPRRARFASKRASPDPRARVPLLWRKRERGASRRPHLLRTEAVAQRGPKSFGT
jgi:hypothetical protein